MNEKISKFFSNLDKEKSKFNILLKRFPEIYAEYKINPIELNKQNFYSLENQLKSSSESLFLLKNEILKYSKSLEDKVINKDEYIDIAKENKQKKTDELNYLMNEDNASIPRENSIKEINKRNKLYLVIQSVVSILSLYFLYKVIYSTKQIKSLY